MHLRVLGVLTALEQGDLWPSASQAWKGGAVGTWDPKRCVVLQLPFYRRSGKSKLPPQFQGIPPLRSCTAWLQEARCTTVGGVTVPRGSHGAFPTRRGFGHFLRLCSLHRDAGVFSFGGFFL